LLAGACLYTYIRSFLAIGALGVAYLVVCRRRQWPHFVMAHLLAAIVFLPWLPVMMATTSRLQADLAAHGGGLPRPGPVPIVEGFAEWAAGPVRWERIRPFGLVFGGAVFLLAGGGLAARRTRRGAKIIGLAFLLPLLGYIVMPMPRVHEYDPKHLVFLQPFLMIALSGVRLRPPSGSRHSLTVAVAAAVLLSGLNAFNLRYYYDGDFEKERWPEAAAYLLPRLEQNDGVVFNPPYVGYAFEYYAGTEEARALVRARAQHAAAGRPVKRIWLVECRSPVAHPSPLIEQKILDGGWRPTLSGESTYRGHLGEISIVPFIPGKTSLSKRLP